MKKKLILISSLLIILTGCVTSELVSFEGEGLLTKHPIRIVDETNLNTLTVRGHISRSDRNSISISNDIPIGDTTSFSHFAFDIPRFQFNGEFEYSFANHIALLGGLTFANINGKEYTGTHFGAALFSVNEINTVRFDIGVKFQRVNYNIVYKSTYERIFNNSEIEINRTSSRGNYRNIYLAFTVHGNNKEVFANYFLSYMLSYQTFIDFEGNIFDLSYELTEALHSLSLGLFKNIDQMGRIIIGARINNFSFDFGESTPFDLFLQYDFSLF